MATITVVNTLTTPRIVDDEGRLLEGSSRGQVDDSQARVKDALRLGVFVQVDPAPTPGTPATSSAPPPAEQPKES